MSTVCPEYLPTRANWHSTCSSGRNSVQTQLKNRPARTSSERSRQMVTCLRENFIYSEKRARDLVFAAMEIVLSRGLHFGHPPTVLRCTRESTRLARETAEKTGFLFATWEITTKAVFNSMLGAGVLLTTDGTPVPIGIQTQATPVVALKQYYQDLTEAYLLECLIRNLSDISIRDHKALAHALFRQFDSSVSVEDMEDRVVTLLATLSERVVLCTNGTYSTRSEPQ